MNNKDAEGCLDWIAKMMFMVWAIWSLASIENRLRDIQWSLERIERKTQR